MTQPQEDSTRFCSPTSAIKLSWSNTTGLASSSPGSGRLPVSRELIADMGGMDNFKNANQLTASTQVCLRLRVYERPLLMEDFVQHDARGHSQVERVAAAHHRNLHHHVTQRLHFAGQPVSFAAHEQDEWRPV